MLFSTSARAFRHIFSLISFLCASRRWYYQSGCSRVHVSRWQEQRMLHWHYFIWHRRRFCPLHRHTQGPCPSLGKDGCHGKRQPGAKFSPVSIQLLTTTTHLDLSRMSFSRMRVHMWMLVMSSAHKLRTVQKHRNSSSSTSALSALVEQLSSLWSLHHSPNISLEAWSTGCTPI